MVAKEDAERVEALIPRFKLEKLLNHGMDDREAMPIQHLIRLHRSCCSSYCLIGED
jgi:hypothetical protein